VSPIIVISDDDDGKLASQKRHSRFERQAWHAVRQATTFLWRHRL